MNTTKHQIPQSIVKHWNAFAKYSKAKRLLDTAMRILNMMKKSIKHTAQALI